MKILKQILTILFALFMISAGVYHFVNPTMYLPFITASLPGHAVIYMSGIAEMGVGVAALIPNTKHWGTLGILILMIAFLPLHIIDVFKDNPAIGTHQLALTRLPIQFVLIAWAWFINKK